MYVGLAKRLKRAGGFNIMAGIRITKRNALWMIWIFLFVAMFWLMWKMLIGAGWLLLWFYYYLLVWPVKKVYRLIKDKLDARQAANSAPPDNEN